MLVQSKLKQTDVITVSQNQAYGPVIESVSCMPLHLSLGLGKQALEIVENEAIVLDKTIKEANGEACLELVEAFQRIETLNLECLQQHQQLEEINEAISNAEDVLQSFLNETAPFHQKEGRSSRYQVHSN